MMQSVTHLMQYKFQHVNIYDFILRMIPVLFTISFFPLFFPLREKHLEHLDTFHFVLLGCVFPPNKKQNKIKNKTAGLVLTHGTKAIQQQSNKIANKSCIYNSQGYKKYFKL